MSTMNSLHDSLTRTIEIRIGLKRKVEDLEAQIKKVKYEIETYRLEEKKIISQFSKPSVQSQFKNIPPAFKKRKVEIVCGINGCTYKCKSQSMGSHRKHCKGPVSVCKNCRFKASTPARQKHHNENCKYDSELIISQNMAGPAQQEPVENPDLCEIQEDIVFESSNTKI